MNQTIVLNEVPDDKQRIVVVDLFSTGWAYHLDLLKKDNRQDISKIYEGYEYLVNIWLPSCRLGDLDTGRVIANIDYNLKENGILPAERHMCIVNPSEKDKPFYDTFVAAISHLKELLLAGKDQWEDLELLKKMGLGKWVC
jgi:hypothetical protein